MMSIKICLIDSLDKVTYRSNSYYFFIHLYFFIPLDCCKNLNFEKIKMIVSHYEDLVINGKNYYLTFLRLVLDSNFGPVSENLIAG
jgi:hypothetical protein